MNQRNLVIWPSRKSSRPRSHWSSEAGSAYPSGRTGMESAKTKRHRNWFLPSRSSSGSYL